MYLVGTRKQELPAQSCSGLRVRTHKLKKDSDDDFEPSTDLNQPVGGLPV